MTHNPFVPSLAPRAIGAVLHFDRKGDCCIFFRRANVTVAAIHAEDEH